MGLSNRLVRIILIYALFSCIMYSCSRLLCFYRNGTANGTYEVVSKTRVVYCPVSYILCDILFNDKDVYTEYCLVNRPARYDDFLYYDYHGACVIFEPVDVKNYDYTGPSSLIRSHGSNYKSYLYCERSINKTFETIDRHLKNVRACFSDIDRTSYLYHVCLWTARVDTGHIMLTSLDMRVVHWCRMIHAPSQHAYEYVYVCLRSRYQYKIQKYVGTLYRDVGFFVYPNRVLCNLTSNMCHSIYSSEQPNARCKPYEDAWRASLQHIRDDSVGHEILSPHRIGHSLMVLWLRRAMSRSTIKHHPLIPPEKRILRTFDDVGESCPYLVVSDVLKGADMSDAGHVRLNQSTMKVLFYHTTDAVRLYLAALPAILEKLPNSDMITDLIQDVQCRSCLSSMFAVMILYIYMAHPSQLTAFMPCTCDILINRPISRLVKIFCEIFGEYQLAMNTTTLLCVVDSSILRVPFAPTVNHFLAALRRTPSIKHKKLPGYEGLPSVIRFPCSSLVSCVSILGPLGSSACQLCLLSYVMHIQVISYCIAYKYIYSQMYMIMHNKGIQIHNCAYTMRCVGERPLIYYVIARVLSSRTCLFPSSWLISNKDR